MIRVEFVCFFGICLLLLAASSCKKVDQLAPDITITSPQENTQFTVFDTVVVRFDVVDDAQLTSVSAKIVNRDLIPVTASQTVNVSGSTSTSEVEMIIADKLLETGIYYALVTASDGINEQREFRKIRIAAIPKVRRAVYFSGAGVAGGIHRLDSLFQDQTLFLDPGQDIRDLCINSLKDRLTIMGHFSAGLVSFNMDNGSVAWSAPVFPVSQTQRFMDLRCYGNETYTTIYDREIRSYSESGALTMNVPTVDDRPGSIYVNDDFLVVERNPVGTETHFVHVYHGETRAFLRSLQIPMDVISMCALEGDKILVFGNDDDQARVLEYHIIGNGYWEPRQLPHGKILDAVKLDGQTYIIAHESGLYSYTYSPNFLNQIRPNIYQDVCFDVAGNRVIAASSNMLEELSVTGQVLNTVIHSDSITSVDVHYTR